MDEFDARFQLSWIVRCFNIAIYSSIIFILLIVLSIVTLFNSALILFSVLAACATGLQLFSTILLIRERHLTKKALQVLNLL